MTLAQRWRDIRTGFERPFWVANLSELFERLSYYAAFASLARYLHEVLQFPIERASTLTGFFGGLVWFLAVFGGTLADRMGFRRALSVAYLILSGSYFLLGSLGAPWMAPIRDAVPLVALVNVCSCAAGAGHRAGQAQRSWHHRPRLQGKRSLHRLLDLLHAGKHRRRSGTPGRVVRASAHARRERLPRGRRQRLPDVHRACCCSSASRAATTKWRPPACRRPARTS